MPEINRAGLPTLPTYPGDPGTAPPAAGPAGADTAHAEQVAAALGIGAPSPLGDGRVDAHGNRLSGATGAAARPPPAPATTVTPQTAAHYQSFATEVNGALADAAAAHQGVPLGGGPIIDPRTDPDGAKEQASAWLSGILAGASQAQGDLLAAFLKLRLSNNAEGMRDLEQLSDNDSDMQKNMMSEQQAHTKQAQESADKAHKKAGIQSKVALGTSIAMLVVTAIVAALSFGTLAPLVAVAAAGVVGFVVGGAVGGKGHGFDITKAIEAATYAADAMMMLIGVGALLEAVGGTLKAAATQGAKVAEKRAMEAGIQRGAQTTGRAAANMALRTSGEAAAQALETQALRASSRVATHEAESLAAQQVADKTKLELFREAFAKSTTKYGFKASDKGLDYVAIGLQAGVDIGGGETKSVLDFRVAQLLADSKGQQADVQMFGALANVFKNGYTTTQDLMQKLVEAHSRAVDAAQSMLRSSHAVGMTITGNYSGR